MHEVALVDLYSKYKYFGLRILFNIPMIKISIGMDTDHSVVQSWGGGWVQARGINGGKGGHL